MKKILFLLLTAISVSSCYNDDELWEKVNNLDGRVETLETTVKNMNTDISMLQSMMDALNQGKVITHTEETAEGYTLTFNDGSKVSVKNGRDGEKGADAPVMGVKKDEDGVYYWTVTTDGVTEWLTEAGQKLKVTGATGITPVMGVDSEGYWTVDTGEGAKRVNGSDGHPVKAAGTDGDSLFQSIDEDDYQVIVTLANGTSFTLPKSVALEVSLEESDNGMKAGETKVFRLNLSEKVDDCFLIATPDGWKAALDHTTLTVTAPQTLTNDNRNGMFKFIASDAEGNCKAIKLSIYAYEIRTLTFEDEDYKGTGNYLGNKDWSSLIDDQQYGGALLYPKDSRLYRWNDENNTFLASEFPNGWGDYQFWGGGHAISNYTEMDMSNGDFMHQLSVYYQDPVTSFGGHNGSKNFCVHYGYRDDSPYASNNKLPYIYFSDNEARVVDHMYVMWSTYLANCIFNGNGLTEPVGPEGYVKIVAIGFDENGKERKPNLEFFISNAGGNIQDWTRWDLSALGKVSKIEFNVAGDSDNGYGFSQPAYFCYDDVAVRF